MSHKNYHRDPYILINHQLIAHQQYHLLKYNYQKPPAYFNSVQQYEKYLITCFEQLYSTLMFFYQIPTGFKIYSDNAQLSDGHQSFNLTFSQSISKGGRHGSQMSNKKMYQFQFIRPVSLLSLDVKTNRQELINLTPIPQRPGIIDILDKYPDTSNGDKLVDFICSMGYDGFISQNWSHRYEIHLCYPKTLLTGAQPIQINLQ